MKTIIALLCCMSLFAQGKNTVQTVSDDQMPIIMANCFAQILAHGIAAAQAGNNKELRVQELSVAIQCAAQFMVQFFNATPTRSLVNRDAEYIMQSMEECLEDEIFMKQLADAFGQEAPMIAALMRSRVYERGLTTVLRSDTSVVSEHLHT